MTTLNISSVINLTYNLFEQPVIPYDTKSYIQDQQWDYHIMF